MQTSRQSPTRARKPAAAAFSPAAAKLINQIQDEARAQLLAELSTKDAITVLHGFDADSKQAYCNGAHLTIEDDKGNSLRIYRHHTKPDAWKSHYWHPAFWSGFETRVDANGTRWERHIPDHVCDDFGNLVQVSA